MAEEIIKRIRKLAENFNEESEANVGIASEVWYNASEQLLNLAADLELELQDGQWIEYGG